MTKGARLMLVAVSMFAWSVAVQAQGGYDLFQTGSGASVDLSSVGLGQVPLKGVPIKGCAGTDTVIHRTQDVPTGGGDVPITMHALYMKSQNSVTFQGQQADVYVTLNNSGGTIPTTVLPQPDPLPASNGTVTARSDGTFDSSITVNPDVIFVKAGADPTVQTNQLGHQAGPSATMKSTGSTWSATTAPSGYPTCNGLPPGHFYPIHINGHLVPPHTHPILPSNPPPSGGGCGISPNPTVAIQPGAKTKGSSNQPTTGAPNRAVVICYE